MLSRRMSGMGWRGIDTMGLGGKAHPMSKIQKWIQRPNIILYNKNHQTDHFKLTAFWCELAQCKKVMHIRTTVSPCKGNPINREGLWGLATFAAIAAVRLTHTKRPFGVGPQKSMRLWVPNEYRLKRVKSYMPTKIRQGAPCVNRNWHRQ
jgi:hypothetical protein